MEVVAFTGGVPKQTYGDRYMLTAYFDDHLLFLDFESPIIDFAFLNGTVFLLFLKHCQFFV